MKNYLIAGLLSAVPVNLFCMFNEIQEIEKKFAVARPDNAFEVIKLLPDSDGRGINIISILKGNIPATFGLFGGGAVDLAKLTVTLTADATGNVTKSTRVVYGPKLSGELIPAVSDIKTRGFNVGTEKISDWELEHKEIYDGIFGKDGVIDSQKAQFAAQNIYDTLLATKKTEDFYFKNIFQNVAAYQKEPAMFAALMPKLQEMAHSLMQLSR